MKTRVGGDVAMCVMGEEDAESGDERGSEVLESGGRVETSDTACVVLSLFYFWCSLAYELCLLMYCPEACGETDGVSE